MEPIPAEIERWAVVESPKGQRPIVGIFAAYNERYIPLAVLAAENWAHYARTHGYALRFYPQGFHLDPNRPSTYGDKGRFNLYYDMRSAGADIIMYLDIDSIFMRDDVKIEDQMVSRDFLYTHDEGGPCSGMWIAKTHERVEAHLRYAYEYAGANNNVRNGVIEPNGISDQDAFTRLMHVPPFSETFGRHNCFSHRESLFCYPQDGFEIPWIISFAGLSYDEKIAGMREWRKRAFTA